MLRKFASCGFTEGVHLSLGDCEGLLLDHVELLGAAQTATESEEGVAPGLHMVNDPQRTLTIRAAALYLVVVLVKVKSLLKGHNVAASAHVSAVETDVEGDIAAETALEVDKLFPMALFVTLVLADADFCQHTGFAPEVFLLDAELLAKDLATVVHAPEVGLLALLAEVESARGHG